jgi:lipoprotein Spr
MIKKIFIIIPAIMMFTACSSKNTLTSDNTILENSSKEVTLSYGEYKKLYDAKNNTVKNKPLSNYEAIITPKEYKALMFNEKEENKSFSEIPKKKQAFTDFYSEWKDVKYKMGGNSKSGIDCSAFTQKIYKEKFGVELPRTTLTQVNMGEEVKKSDLKPGDLVFFKTSKTDKHVGVYVGNNNFLHASIRGIQFTSMDKPFYKKNYWTSRRIID